MAKLSAVGLPIVRSLASTSAPGIDVRIDMRAHTCVPGIHIGARVDQHDRHVGHLADERHHNGRRARARRPERLATFFYFWEDV